MILPDRVLGRPGWEKPTPQFLRPAAPSCRLLQVRAASSLPFACKAECTEGRLCAVLMEHKVSSWHSTWRPVDDVRGCNGPDDLAHGGNELLLELRRRRVLGALPSQHKQDIATLTCIPACAPHLLLLVARCAHALSLCARAKGDDDSAEDRGSRAAHHHEGDEGVDGLPLDGVVHGHHGRLRALGVVAQRALHLRRADPVTAHIDDIIHAPCACACNPLTVAADTSLARCGGACMGQQALGVPGMGSRDPPHSIPHGNKRSMKKRFHRFHRNFPRN